MLTHFHLLHMQCLLPSAPAPGERIASPRSGGCLMCLTKVLTKWLTEPQEGASVGQEFAALLNRVLAYLLSHPSLKDTSKSQPENDTRPAKIKDSATFFIGTLLTAMGWLDRMPQEERCHRPIEHLYLCHVSSLFLPFNTWFKVAGRQLSPCGRQGEAWPQIMKGSFLFSQETLISVSIPSCTSCHCILRGPLVLGVRSSCRWCDLIQKLVFF